MKLWEYVVAWLIILLIPYPIIAFVLWDLAWPMAIPDWPIIARLVFLAFYFALLFALTNGTIAQVKEDRMRNRGI